MLRKALVLSAALLTLPHHALAQDRGFFNPARIVASIGTAIDDDHSITGAAGLPERINLHRMLMYRLQLNFLLLLPAVFAASRDEPDLLYFNAPASRGHDRWELEATTGLTGRHGNVSSLQNVFGGVFPTAGNTDFMGGYIGLNGRFNGSDPMNRWSFNLFGNVGFGKGEVDAFGGAFKREETGLFYEAGAGVQYRVSDRVRVGPTISYFHFDQGAVEMKDWTAEFTVTIDLN
ncbi:MAG: hypothetical protein RID23_12175 [Roseovarius sp.]